MKKRGFKPKLQKLDNEASTMLKEYMEKESIDFQLTSVGIHRRNKVERAIQTFENHFVAGLCSVDPTFPLHLWDKLIPQAVITLNLLRPSRINPKLSAYAQLHGPFDYNRTPLASPRIQLPVHVRPEDRKSWDPHAVEAFYVDPAMNHYRCRLAWIKQTGKVRVVQQVKWLPHGFRMPNTSRDALIIAAANDLTAALKSTDDNPLLPPMGTQTKQQLTILAQAFQNAVPNICKKTNNNLEMQTTTPAAPRARLLLTNRTSDQRVQQQTSTRTQPRVTAKPRVTAEPRVPKTHSNLQYQRQRKHEEYNDNNQLPQLTAQLHHCHHRG